MGSANETKKLQNYLLEEWQNFIEEGSPVDNAIRLLEEFKPIMEARYFYKNMSDKHHPLS